jgi:hypothetical protein
MRSPDNTHVPVSTSTMDRKPHKTGSAGRTDSVTEGFCVGPLPMAFLAGNTGASARSMPRAGGLDTTV